MVRDRRPRILFINDSTPYGNWGGRAATTALRVMIKEAGGDIVHTLFINELETSRLDGIVPPPPAVRSPLKEAVKPFIPPVVLQLRERAQRPRRAATGPPLIPTAWRDFDAAADRVTGAGTPWPELMRGLSQVDAAVVFGDGDIYGNHLLPRTLLFLSYVLKRRLGIPVIMVAHSADFDHADLRTMAEHVYPLYDDVVFRDRVSLGRCRPFCDGRFAPDSAFWYQPAPREAWAAFAARTSYFGIWPNRTSFDPRSPYLCIGGSSAFAAAGGDLTGQYARLIEHLRSTYAGQLVLTASDRVDEDVFRPLADRHGLPLISEATPVQQAVDIVGNADAYIGGRFHVAVFALRGGVPVVPLSAKTFKMEALTDLAGLPSATFPAALAGRDAEAIGKALGELLGQGDGLRTRLSSWGAEMARDSWENVGYLRRMPSGSFESAPDGAGSPEPA
jgi:polysaccharide pyruvyl transferase WcaK-like protein